MAAVAAHLNCLRDKTRVLSIRLRYKMGKNDASRGKVRTITLVIMMLRYLNLFSMLPFARPVHANIAA